MREEEEEGSSHLVEFMVHLVEDECSVIICREPFDNTMNWGGGDREVM